MLSNQAQGLSFPPPKHKTMDSSAVRVSFKKLGVMSASSGWFVAVRSCHASPTLSNACSVTWGLRFARVLSHSLGPKPQESKPRCYCDFDTDCDCYLLLLLLPPPLLLELLSTDN